MKNRKILIIIAVAVIGILGILTVQAYERDQSYDTIGDNSVNEIIDSMKDGSQEFKEEVTNEIDDHTNQ